MNIWVFDFLRVSRPLNWKFTAYSVLQIMEFCKISAFWKIGKTAPFLKNSLQNNTILKFAQTFRRARKLYSVLSNGNYFKKIFLVWESLQTDFPWFFEIFSHFFNNSLQVSFAWYSNSELRFKFLPKFHTYYRGLTIFSIHFSLDWKKSAKYKKLRKRLVWVIELLKQKKCISIIFRILYPM